MLQRDQVKAAIFATQLEWLIAEAPRHAPTSTPPFQLHPSYTSHTTPLPSATSIQDSQATTVKIKPIRPRRNEKLCLRICLMPLKRNHPCPLTSWRLAHTYIPQSRADNIGIEETVLQGDRTGACHYPIQVQLWFVPPYLPFSLSLSLVDTESLGRSGGLQVGYELIN